MNTFLVLSHLLLAIFSLKQKTKVMKYYQLAKKNVGQRKCFMQANDVLHTHTHEGTSWIHARRNDKRHFLYQKGGNFACPLLACQSWFSKIHKHWQRNKITSTPEINLVMHFSFIKHWDTFFVTQLTAFKIPYGFFGSTWSGLWGPLWTSPGLILHLFVGVL